MAVRFEDPPPQFNVPDPHEDDDHDDEPLPPTSYKKSHKTETKYFSFLSKKVLEFN